MYQTWEWSVFGSLIINGVERHRKKDCQLNMQLTWSKEWVKINWEQKRGFVTRPPGEQLNKEPKFSTLSNKELIEKIFEDRIITNADHEAVKYQWTGIANGNYGTKIIRSIDI